MVNTGLTKAEPVNAFLSDPGVPGVRSMGPDASPSIQDQVLT